MHSPNRNSTTAMIRVSNSLRSLGNSFISTRGPMAASSVPNSLSIPRRINIKKNRMAQSGDTSINSRASENVIKARPGPDPTCFQQCTNEISDLQVY